MRVLLRLGRVQLREPGAGQDLGEHLGNLLLVERHREREVLAVARHRRQRVAALEQPLRELPRPVGPEVEEDRLVVRRQPRAAGDDHRLDELVGDVARRSSSRTACDRVVGRLPLALGDGGEGTVGALPACIAVHRPVAPGDRRDALGAAARRGRRAAECGDTSRPSVNAWMNVRSSSPAAAPAPAARAGGRCASARRRARRARAGARWRRASARARTRRRAPGCSRNDPSSIAWLTRWRSWKRMRPEPIVRCPTSELPIWPGGRPTASPDAWSVVCG